MPRSCRDFAEGLLGTDNVFQVRIRADVGRRGGLSQLVVGPQEEVYRGSICADYHWRGTGSTMVVAAFSLLVGMLALRLVGNPAEASPRPGLHRRDPLYLYAGLAELCWTFGVGDARARKASAALALVGHGALVAA